MRDEPMMTCREAIEELWAYIDGELTEEARADVHEHLRACARCYPHYDFQKAFREFVARNSHVAVPAALRRKVFLRLLAEEAREKAGSGG